MIQKRSVACPCIPGLAWRWAMQKYQEGLKITKRLAERDKSNAGRQRDLSVS